MMEDSRPKTPVMFSVFVLIYFVILIAASIWICQSEEFPDSHDDEYVQAHDVKHSDISNVLVDQLKENKKGYLNNVWTTLGTIIAAIGMVLGSTKFQRILQSDKLSIPVVQLILIILYGLHGYAYMLYQGGNIELMQKLESVAGSIYYYRSYMIQDIEVIFNLLFDTVLFILLAYIIGRIKDIEVDG
ncbi:MAG: hypothetical protein ACN4GM_05125 [Gammaproteobacteria bacterium]